MLQRHFHSNSEPEALQFPGNLQPAIELKRRKQKKDRNQSKKNAILPDCVPVPVSDSFSQMFTPPSGNWSCLHHFFEACVERTPDAIAVEHVELGLRLTYAELNARANQLARLLRAEGVGTDQLVGVHLTRGIDWYISILGILKAGAAYLPIDAEFPRERVNYILEDAEATFVLTHRCLAEKFQNEGASEPTHRMLVLNEMTWSDAPESSIALEDVEVLPSSLCYVIYTSGTTGHPKGVCLSHLNATTFVQAMLEVYQVEPTDRVLQGFSTSFDASVEEIWMAFATGAALIVGTLETMRVVDELPQKLRDFGVTVFSTVPTLLSVLNPQDLPQLRLLIMGGEAARADIIERWSAPQRRILNTYGPTECSVVATYAEAVAGAVVTIGKPMPGYEVAILDHELQPVINGQEGELCVCGSAVSLRGYLRRPELNEKKFIQLNGERYYRTGDLVSLNAEGNLLFCGRIDAQVKIRGYRIELEEIETLLVQFAKEQNAEQAEYEGAIVGVHADEARGPQLVAYLLQHTVTPVSLGPILAQLREKLPAYMVPSHFVSLHPDAVPCLTSGKIDRKRLPSMESCARLTAAMQNDYIPALSEVCESELEQSMLQIWRDVLQAPALLPTDSFFDFGGNSVAAAETITRCRQHAEFEALSIRDIYQFTTVRSLLQRLEQRHALQREKQANQQHGNASAQASGEALPPYIAPRRQYLMVSAAQTAMIIGGFFFGTYAMLATLYLFYKAYTALTTVMSPVAAGFVLYGSLVLLAPVFLLSTLAFGFFWKRVLIGTYREMDIPLWSWAYFRWWVANSFLAPMRGLAGAFLGTPLANFCFRVLGAKIGRNVYLGVPLIEADLVTIEDGASIATGAILTTHSIEAGMLKLRPLHIGKNCYVGSQATVSMGVRMGEGTILHPLSILEEGIETPAFSEWQGSPGESIEPNQTALAKILQRHAQEAQPSDGWSNWKDGLRVYAMQYAMSFVSGLLMVPPFVLYVLMLVGLELAFGAVLSLNLAILLPATLIFSAVRFSSTMASLIATKWLLTGRAQEGTIPLNSFEYVRRWLCASLMSTLTSPKGLRPFAETLLAPYVCRWFGMEVGKNVEVSDLTGGQPDLVKLGNNVMLADGCYIAAPIVHHGRMTLGKVEIGDYTFVGNGAVIPVTTPKIGEGCLLGVLTTTPDGEVPARTDWLGSPALQLPQRIRTNAPEELTFKPTRRMIVARAFANFWKIVLPNAVLDSFFWITLKLALLLYTSAQLGTFLLVLPLLFLASSIATFMSPVLLKWVLIGRFQSGERYLWSNWMWRMETLYEIELMLTSSYGSLVNGTPWIVQWYRAMGAKLGKQVFMNDGFLMEADLIHVEDYVTLSGTGLQTHLFEDRVMKLGPIHIGKGASIGNACVLYNTSIGENATLGDVSLVMKNEVLSPSRRYHGLPSENVI